ncbi:MAG: carotenoid 1,2-hydratase [Aquabacterium commune]|uniref:lipocalin-like domain-containing protein n=1 Tax=Aquabacterium commune TaxID=70586 RepID=UPI003BAE5327
MAPTRRAALQTLAAGLAWGTHGAHALSPMRALPPVLHPGEPLRFPQDFGAHPAFRTEWWYLTGSLWPQDDSARNNTAAAAAASTAPGAHRPAPLGFQITFFRSRVDAAADSRSAFAARQLVFAHAALTDVAAARLVHDQRIGRTGFGLVEAHEGDTHVVLRDWTLQRSGPAERSTYASRVTARDFTLDLRFTQTQALLLQGDAGFSQKGPRIEQASRYYSHPQLQVSGQLTRAGRTQAVSGRAWMDHEWSESLLDADAVGWDWIGMNLDDGGALTAFRLRRADGSTLWAGGSLRAPGQPVRKLSPDEVRFTPLRHWTSPATRARYPVAWQVDVAGQRFTVEARTDAQELDSRGSTGSVYWEGLSTLRDARGQAVGSGYLEMTGYSGALRL